MTRPLDSTVMTKREVNEQLEGRQLQWTGKKRSGSLENKKKTKDWGGQMETAVEGWVYQLWFLLGKLFTGSGLERGEVAVPDRCNSFEKINSSGSLSEEGV